MIGGIMLKAIDLTKRYEDGKLALDHVSLEVGEGMVFCLLGANGAGKTTTINLFLDFIQPSEGEALINGINVNKKPLDAKEHVAFVSENVMLYGNFSARQNLDYFARLGGKRSLTKKDYYDYMRRAGLKDEDFEAKVRTFSKGMRQKLGITIAVIRDTENILLDEPTSGLDPRAAAEFVGIINNLRAEGKSILMSTHDIFRAKELADYVGIMKAGRLVMVRSREEFLDADLETVYLDYMQSSAS